jgi:hypothetical protein
MSAQYRLDLRTTAGVKVAELTDYIGTLTYRRAVNRVGLLQFALPADHASIADLTDKAIVEVWRRDPILGVPWHRDYDGIVRTTQYGMDSSGREAFTVWAPSSLHMLSWRTVGYAAGVANRSTYSAVPAETLMKSLVTYNATSAGTVVDGRFALATIAGISVEADAAGGNTLTKACAYANLLAILEELAVISGGDFELYQTGGATWEFRFHAGQLGTDRSATLAFAPNLGNMANPVYTDARTDERTVAIVGGQGEGAARATVLRTGTNYHVTTNNIETFVDARNQTATAGLNAKGDAALASVEARPSFTFDILQTSGCRYGVEFGVGDLATARYRDVVKTVKITGITVSVTDQGEETLGFDTETV